MIKDFTLFYVQARAEEYATGSGAASREKSALCVISDGRFHMCLTRRTFP